MSERDPINAELDALRAQNKTLREALKETTAQCEGCYLNHYGYNPDTMTLPDYIRRAIAILMEPAP